MGLSLDNLVDELYVKTCALFYKLKTQQCLMKTLNDVVRIPFFRVSPEVNGRILSSP